MVFEIREGFGSIAPSRNLLFCERIEGNHGRTVDDPFGSREYSRARGGNDRIKDMHVGRRLSVIPTACRAQERDADSEVECQTHHDGWSSLTPEIHLQGHKIRCGRAAAATIAPLSGATHVR